MNRAVLSILVSNHFGVLTRVTNLFSQRGFNIDSLAVGETENEKLFPYHDYDERGCSECQSDRLQLDKLEDVKIVQEIPDEQLFIREVMLVKVAPRVNQMEAFEKCVEDFNGRTQIIEDGCCIVELTDTPASVNYFLEERASITLRKSAAQAEPRCS